MFNIRYATPEDKAFWFSLDRHISDEVFMQKARDHQCYIILKGPTPIGLMRYNLFWDSIPFLTLLYFDLNYRKKGFGRQSMAYWEEEMKQLGHKMVMTSTQADEQAQHFYRKLGYLDKGSLFLDHTPFEQAPEILMVKVL